MYTNTEVWYYRKFNFIVRDMANIYERWKMFA